MFLCLGLEVSIQLFNFPFLFFKFCCFTGCQFLLILPLLAAVKVLCSFLYIHQVHTSTQSSMLVGPLPPSFLDTRSLCHLLGVSSGALSSIFLFFGLFAWVPSLLLLRRVQSILLRDYSGIYSLLQILVSRSFSSEVLLSTLFSFISVCLIVSASNIPCPVGWGCRIHRLHLWRGVRRPNKCLGYDSKQSDGEVPVMLEL